MNMFEVLSAGHYLMGVLVGGANFAPLTINLDSRQDRWTIPTWCDLGGL